MLVCVVLFAALSLSYLFSCLFRAQEDARMSQCKANLKQIGFAIQQYQLVYGHLPAARLNADADRQPHSWRVAIQPYLGWDDDQIDYNFSEPWDNEENLQFASSLYPRHASLMACPTHAVDTTPGKTSFFSIVGESTILLKNTPRVLTEEYVQENPDKIIICESHSRDAIWTEPVDLTIEQIVNEYTADPPTRIHTQWVDSGRKTIAHVFCIDGHVERLELPVDREEFIRRLTY